MIGIKMKKHKLIPNIRQSWPGYSKQILIGPDLWEMLLRARSVCILEVCKAVIDG